MHLSHQRRASRPLWVVPMIGGGILWAWLFPHWARATLPEGWDVMTASTAMCSLALSAALLNVSRDGPRAAWVFAVGVMLTVLLVLGSFVEHLCVDIQQLPNVPWGQFWRPMSLQTAAGMLMFAAVALGMRHWSHTEWPDLLLFVLGVLCAMLSVGYGMGQLHLIGQSALVRTSPHTLVVMWLLLLGAGDLRRQSDAASLYAQEDVFQACRTRLNNLVKALKDGQ